MLYVETFYFTTLPEELEEEDDVISNYNLRLQFALEKYIEAKVYRELSRELQPRLRSVRFPTRQVLSIQLYKGSDIVAISEEQASFLKEALKEFEPYKDKTLLLDVKMYSKEMLIDYYWIMSILPLLDMEELFVWNDQVYFETGEDFERDYFWAVNTVSMQIQKMYQGGVWPVPPTFSKDIIQNWQLQPYFIESWTEEDNFYTLPIELARSQLSKHEAMKQIVTSSDGKIRMFIKIGTNEVIKYFISLQLHALGIIPVFDGPHLIITLASLSSYMNLVALVDNVESSSFGKVSIVKKEDTPKAITDGVTWYQTLTYEKPITVSMLINKNSNERVEARRLENFLRHEGVR